MPDPVRPELLSFGPQSDDFRNLEIGLSLIVEELRKPPDVPGSRQRIAELEAAKQYLNAPLRKKEILLELLVKPMRQIYDQAPSDSMRKIAGDFLKWNSQR